MIIVSSKSYRPRLFEIFPDLGKNLAWIPLVNTPTPVGRLETASAQLGPRDFTAFLKTAIAFNKRGKEIVFMERFRSFRVRGRL